MAGRVRTKATQRHEEIIARLERIEQAQVRDRAVEVQEALLDVLRGLQATLDRLEAQSE